MTTIYSNGKPFVEVDSSGNVIGAYANDGTMTPAKYLFDVNGNPVINPQTEKPYIVPADYNSLAAIQFGQNQASLINPLTSPNFLTGFASNVVNFTLSFWPGGSLDLQRTYNGVSGAFVPAFTPIASYNFGLASAAYGLSIDSAYLAGGAVNLIKADFYAVLNSIGVPRSVPNIDGIYYNNSNNPQNIAAGQSAFYNGVWGNTPLTPPAALTGTATTTANPDGSTTVTSADGLVSDTTWVDSLGRMDQHDLVINSTITTDRTAVDQAVNPLTGGINNQQVIDTASNGQVTDNVSGQGAVVNQSNAIINEAAESGTAINGSGNTATLAPNASATITGNSDTLTLGSNTSATINGKLDVLNGSIANLTIGAGSSAKVFGAYNTIVAGAGSSVTSFGDNISFSAAPNTSATFDASGTNDNFNVDNSLINIPTQNCTDGIHCQGDTINASTGDTITISGDGRNGLADIVNMTSGTLDLSSNANDYMGPSTIRLMAA